MSHRPPAWRDSETPIRQPITRFRVVLLKSGDELLAIARAIADLTRYGDAESRQRMWEVYHRGRADVLVTHFERGELYVEQFAERGLSATLEPA
jgi:ATP-dependent Clp protease adapter protein ClpS